MLLPKRAMHGLRGYIVASERYVAFYPYKGLLIRVYRLIVTFWDYGALGRLCCLLFVSTELNGAWLGCSLSIFFVLRFICRSVISLPNYL